MRNSNLLRLTVTAAVVGLVLGACSAEERESAPFELAESDAASSADQGLKTKEAAVQASEDYAAPNPQADIRPVMIGQDGADFDACGGYGQITNVEANGMAALPVRAAPNVGAYPDHEVSDGTAIFLCEYDNGWHGIVFDGGEDMDCGASSPVAAPVEYDGPCKSGWVQEEYIELLAG